MIAKVRSMGLQGIGGYEVLLEVYISNGLPAFDVVGLPDAAVREARERVRAAIKNNGYRFPVSRMTVNLAPADKKKAGTLYDLPMFIGILAADGDIDEPGDDCAFIGELSLSGELRPVYGALPMAIAAARCGVKKLFVPADNAAEAAFADGISVYPVKNVDELLRLMRGEVNIEPAAAPALDTLMEHMPDFSEVKGQENVKRALEIAAAGGHNILIVGPPGAGKSMMAKRLPGILPDMSRGEMIQSTEIYSVAGLTSREHPIVSMRPFRAPHHTVSAAGLSGGGTSPRPGEISLAHNGVLFLDELPEYGKNTLDVLRQPLEGGTVTVSRSAHSVTFPADCMLVAAMNPCPCGYATDPRHTCVCSPGLIRRYRARLSGPLLDRIDLHINVPAVPYEELQAGASPVTSARMRERVLAARAVQQARYAEVPYCRTNADLSGSLLEKHCRMGAPERAFLREAVQRLALSARAYTRILRISRTIADLAGSESIGVPHLAEAIGCRVLDREAF